MLNTFKKGSLIGITLLLASALPVLAEKTLAGRSSMQDKTEQTSNNNKVDEKNNSSDKTVKTSDKKFTPQKQARIKGLLANIEKNDSDKIERLDGLALKFQAMIDKIKLAGVNVITLNTSLDSAKNLLKEAQDSLGKTKDNIENALISATPKKAVEEIKGGFKAIGQKIREARQSLMDVIKNLKEMQAPSGADVKDKIAPSDQETPAKSPDIQSQQ